MDWKPEANRIVGDASDILKARCGPYISKK